MKDGHKVARPITSREEYLTLRGSEFQKRILTAARAGNEKSKRYLVQMNYSIAPPQEASPLPPNGEGTESPATEGIQEFPLKGCKTPSDCVAMDVDLTRDEDLLSSTAKHILEKSEELGLLMLERSVNKGFHLVFKRKFYDGIAEGRILENQEKNLRWASDLLGVEFDPGAKDITRVFFTTSDSDDDLLYLDDEIFSLTPALSQGEGESPEQSNGNPTLPITGEVSRSDGEGLYYQGIPYDLIIKKWWELYNDGKEPCTGNRNTLTFELAVNLRHICGFDRDLMMKVIPDYWETPRPPLGGGLTPAQSTSAVEKLPLKGDGGSEKLSCIDSALSEKRSQMPRRLRDVLTALKKDNIKDEKVFAALEEVENEDELFYYNRIPKGAFPQGIRESIQSTGPKMVMPVLAVTCPMIGALATDVKVAIHGKETKLNMHSFVVGDAASCKGDLDAVVEAWMAEESQKNEMYYAQEEEYRSRKKAAKNSKQQPEEPHLPVRFLTMNNTVANLAERLSNTNGKHAFSFTPEADTVAMKWRSSMCDFSTMLRQSYDGSRYDREAKSADATTVHIDHLLWNVCMCGTPDALYRVINNYTDGLLSRFILAHTPDNTFSPLEEKPNLMTLEMRDKIIQIAHLLPLMQGTLELPKLEAKSREWVEKVRKEALMDDDRVRARARLRDHGTAMRMTTCLILCMVAERLIRQHGPAGAEKQLKMHPDLTASMALKCQTPPILETYSIIAESLIDNDMYFFRDKLEMANESSGMSQGYRTRRGQNDRIFDRLADSFSFEEAMGAKGQGCSRNTVHQMLKNWRSQGLIISNKEGQYIKVKAVIETVEEHRNTDR